MSLILSLLVFLIIWAIVFYAIRRFVPEIISAIGLPGIVYQLILALFGLFFIFGLLGFIPGYNGPTYYHYAGV